jgi:serine/threonine-protein kinase
MLMHKLKYSALCVQGWSLKYYNYNTDIEPHLRGAPIGQGGFGLVHKGCIGGQDVAIKIVCQSRGAASTRGIDALMVELNYVSRLQLGCPYIVRLLGMSHSDVGALCLVYEYANMGCMHCVPEDLDFCGAVRLFAQFAKGLQHMHNLSTVHGDLKPHNLLLHREGEGGAVRGLLADLGMAKLVPIGAQGVKGDRGTRGFVAPECRPTTTGSTFVTFASDVYSFGVTMGCLVTGAKPEVIVAHARAIHPAATLAACKAAAAALERRVLLEFDLQGTNTLVKRFIALVLMCCRERPGSRPTTDALVASLERIASS